MKNHLMSVVTLMLLMGGTACTQLSQEDKSLLAETHAMAAQARDEAIEAKDLAKQAQISAAQSAADAKAASKKADRIFREGQNK